MPSKTHMTEHTESYYDACASAWAEGMSDAQSFDECYPEHVRPELQDDYIAGYAKGMDVNLYVTKGIAPSQHRSDD